ncbi:MAG: flagellar basal body-associated FliL family protein [Acidobacteriota bacterium]|nr:flagellar basal body-associated FliL family protein [Acidobacteriota bacterium]
MTHRSQASAKTSNAGSASARKGDAPPVATIKLDTFVVNLADQNNDAYLRLSVTLGLGKALPKEDNSSVTVPEVRDTILGVLTAWQSSDLLAQGGKAKLKAQLLAALDKRDPGLDVQDIYFTDFLIQE